MTKEEIKDQIFNDKTLTAFKDFEIENETATLLKTIIYINIIEHFNIKQIYNLLIHTFTHCTSQGDLLIYYDIKITFFDDFKISYQYKQKILKDNYITY